MLYYCISTNKCIIMNFVNKNYDAYERSKKMKKKHIYTTMDNGAGAIEANEGNLGPEDSYGYDESDKN